MGDAVIGRKSDATDILYGVNIIAVITVDYAMTFVKEVLVPWQFNGV